MDYESPKHPKWKREDLQAVKQEINAARSLKRELPKEVVKTLATRFKRSEKAIRVAYGKAMQDSTL